MLSRVTYNLMATCLPCRGNLDSAVGFHLVPNLTHVALVFQVPLFNQRVLHSNPFLVAFVHANGELRFAKSKRNEHASIAMMGFNRYKQNDWR